MTNVPTCCWYWVSKPIERIRQLPNENPTVGWRVPIYLNKAHNSFKLFRFSNHLNFFGGIFYPSNHRREIWQ